MFEHRREPLLPRAFFIRRVFKFATISSGLAAISLLLGILGYRIFEDMAWIDAFVNAAMILGGMGPVSELHTSIGKLFAGIYALYCGLLVIIYMSILIAPIFHRFLHIFHLEYINFGPNDPLISRKIEMISTTPNLLRHSHWGG